MPTPGHCNREWSNATVKRNLLGGCGGCIVVLNAVKTGIFVVDGESSGSSPMGVEGFVEGTLVHRPFSRLLTRTVPSNLVDDSL